VYSVLRFCLEIVDLTIGSM